MARHSQNKRRSGGAFKRRAKKTHALNLMNPPRGGIRL